MTPEVLSRLFTPFTQGDASTTRRFGGTGLGLSISHRLVELMGGKLDVESREGIGSRFWFSVGLPVVTEIDANVSSMSRSQLSVHQAPGEVRGQSDMPVHMHVLLAEDNAVNQRVARKQLEHIGCKVTVVPNGREAVARASEQRFDAVFMDCHMPEMDGFTAARAIREVESRNDTRTPIIALTAGAMEQDRLACLAAGMDDYLSKPIDAGALRATLLRWVSKEVELRDNHVEGRA
jgi:CheY-like chemotaxis protein